MKVDTQKLKELAENAASAELGLSEKWVNEESAIVLESGAIIADYVLFKVVSDYILAVQPQAILALLDERDELEAENARLVELGNALLKGAK
jgi:hypothetical protein